jgi:enoyl-CoA hydratase/carnithine racemase
MGVTHAADLILTGRMATAGELRHTGFFTKVLPREGFLEAVYDYARTLASVSPSAATTAKRQIWGDLLSADPAACVEASKLLIGQHMSHPDYAEAIAAMREGRPAKFGPAPGGEGHRGRRTQTTPK